MDAPYKLQVKLPNGADFNAEGPQDIVQKAFERFLSISEKMPAGPVPPKPAQPSHDLPGKGGYTPGQIDKSILDRAYLTDTQKGIVSLRVLPPEGPNRASDAAIMILYGAQCLLHKTEFKVTRLKKGLQKSGIQVGRIDRLMDPYQQIIIKGGAGVGGKYSLNNQGLIKVEELLRKIFS